MHGPLRPSKPKHHPWQHVPGVSPHRRRRKDRRKNRARDPFRAPSPACADKPPDRPSRRRQRDANEIRGFLPPTIRSASTDPAAATHLALVAHLDRLASTSSGAASIIPPAGDHRLSELFLAVAGERTKRIRLGTGVVSLPYHHPFNVAQRIVQLDHLTRAGDLRHARRAAVDARPSGSTNLLRDRRTRRSASSCAARRRRAVQLSERLVQAERSAAPDPACRKRSDGRRLVDQPLRHAARRQYGMGVLSIASTSVEGLQALPTQWASPRSARQHGKTVDRRDCGVMSWHLAESKKQAQQEAVDGLWWCTTNIMSRPRAARLQTGRRSLGTDQQGDPGSGRRLALVIGTPDELSKPSGVAGRDRRLRRRPRFLP